MHLLYILFSILKDNSKLSENKYVRFFVWNKEDDELNLPSYLTLLNLGKDTSVNPSLVLRQLILADDIVTHKP